ncbi:glutathione peroxidase [Mangrovibacterium marinum]|uniref:Glutathione peroxidase n=1 Tax=Mangrovibacterium marinum TaxID=1639118 RepID=A0A2T5C324_9BACT|nr:glutathione peroxidase [Mangrovibacterium marinum]PTN09168.1 glutathione peroxidase [Mangrovibacterium marinum]
MKTIYDYKAKSLQGKEVALDEFKGKVVVIVNTASKCGFTPQYAGLEQLYEKYKDQGLVVLGFPCNQFGNQEPGGAKDIQEGCLVNYGVSFRMFEKIDVNGDQEHPLYTFLKARQPGILGRKIKWNFTKFLIDRQGNPVKRFAPISKPEKMEKDILKLL